MTRPVSTARHLAAMSLAAAALLAAGSAAAMAQQGPSDADRAACRSDAIRFCRAEIGRPKEVLDCLAKVKDQISKACLAVVTANGGR